MLERLLSSGGYLAVVVGTFFEGEAVLLAAAALCQHGVLSLPLVLLSGFAGSFAWTEFWFHTGRKLGDAQFGRSPAWQARSQQFERWMTRYARLFVVGFRFVAGMSTVSPILLGATGYSKRRFALFDALGAAAWAGVFGCLGWGVAASLESALRRATRIQQIAAAIVLFGFVLWGVPLVRRLLAHRDRVT